MKDNHMTVKSWSEIVEVNDEFAENLNGGSGHFNLYINGGIGSLQQNGKDGLQVNVLSKGYASNCYSHGKYYGC
jgi:hypothetical protein